MIQLTGVDRGSPHAAKGLTKEAGNQLPDGERRSRPGKRGWELTPTGGRRTPHPEVGVRGKSNR